MKQYVGVLLFLIPVVFCQEPAEDKFAQRLKSMKELEEKVLEVINKPVEAAQLYLKCIRKEENNFGVDRQYELLRMHGKLLLLAAAFGHAQVVEKLLRGGKYQVDETNYYGKTALFYAIESRHLVVVRLLLEYGADMYKRNGYNETPVGLAVGLPEYIHLLQMYAPDKKQSKNKRS